YRCRVNPLWLPALSSSLRADTGVCPYILLLTTRGNQPSHLWNSFVPAYARGLTKLCSSCISHAISAAAGTLAASIEACAPILQYFNVVLSNRPISSHHCHAAA